MRNNSPIKFALIFALGFCCICACKKDTNLTEFTRLLGKWQEVQYATDDNNNGVLDAWELKNVNPGYLIYLNFNSDSTGKESETVSDSTTVYPFTWITLENDSLQRNGIGHDTVIYHIENITALSLTLKTSGDKGLIWYKYNKK